VLRVRLAATETSRAGNEASVVVSARRRLVNPPQATCSMEDGRCRYTINGADGALRMRIEGEAGQVLYEGACAATATTSLEGVSIAYRIPATATTFASEWTEGRLSAVETDQSIGLKGAPEADVWRTQWPQALQLNAPSGLKCYYTLQRGASAVIADQAYVGSLTVDAPASPVDGSWTLTTYGVDVFGRRKDARVVGFRLDTTAPAAPTCSGVEAGGVYTAAISPTLTPTPQDAGSPIASFYRLDSGEETPLNESVTLAKSALPVGAHTLLLYARDEAGLASQYLTISFKRVPDHITAIFAPKSLTLEAGKSRTLACTYDPAELTGEILTYESSAPAIASVLETGLVTAHRAGSAVLIVRARGGCEATVAVTVTQLPKGIRLSSASLRLLPLETRTLTATLTPSDTTFTGVSWASDNPSVATVDARGKVTAIAVGSARIAATDAAGHSAECMVEVYERVRGIHFAQSQWTLPVGGRLTVETAVEPAYLRGNISWSSTDTAVATVADGVITALETGTATISAISTDGGNIRAEGVLTVLARPKAERVTVWSKGKDVTGQNLKLGLSGTLPLSAVVTPAGASPTEGGAPRGPADRGRSRRSATAPAAPAPCRPPAPRADPVHPPRTLRRTSCRLAAASTARRETPRASAWFRLPQADRWAQSHSPPPCAESPRCHS
jgi:uncharacterized protein YjdB